MFSVNLRTNKMEVVQGDTVDFTVTPTNYVFSDGDTVHFTVKDKNGVELISKQFTVFTDGIVNIKLSATETNIATGTHECDIQCNLADGTVDTVFLGTFLVRKGVTE